MEAWLLIDNNTVQFSLVTEQEQAEGQGEDNNEGNVENVEKEERKRVTGEYTYSTSYTTSALQANTIGNISESITIDPKGGPMIQLKLHRQYTLDELNELRKYINNNVPGHIKIISNKEEIKKHTSFAALQAKHRLPQLCGKIEESSSKLLSFYEYVIYQVNESGYITQLYPKIPVGLDKFKIVDVQRIKQIDDIKFEKKANIDFTLSGVMTVNWF